MRLSFTCAIVVASIGCIGLSATAADLLVPSQHPTIQGAINAAAPGDSVLVSPGIYSERIDLKGKAIHLKSTGSRTNTFISPGGATGAVVSCITSEPAGCIVEGFTIYGATGPGIAITSASPVFKFCAISQNYNSASNGGGVAFTGTGGSPRFEDCQFFGNRAVGREGGGMALTSTAATMTCVRCTFSTNEATGSFGGAIYSTTVTLNLTDCTFNSNAVTATQGDRQGGAIYTNAALIATGCTFNGNGVTVPYAGGTSDKHARGGAICSNGSISLAACSFVSNKAEGPGGYNGYSGSAWGGALYLHGSVPIQITNCQFTSNTVLCNGGDSYRAARGGAVCAVSGADPQLTDCTFAGNSASTTNYSSGGTLWYDNGSVGVVLRCTISGSTAGTEGGAVFLNGGSTPTFSGTTFLNCSTTAANSNGGAVRAQDAANASIHDCRFSNCTSPNGGAIYTRNSNVFVFQSSFDNNTSASGSAIKTEGSGISNVPSILSSRFCSNSGTSTNWVLGNWNNPKPGSNSFDASCGPDCNSNGIVDTVDIASGIEDDCDSNGQPDSCQPDCDGDGIINTCEIADGAPDCDANAVPDSCQLAQGAADVNHDGILDSCVPVDFAGLHTEIVPIIDRSSDPTIPTQAICYRIYADFAGPGGAIWGVYGNLDSHLVLSSATGFYESEYAGDFSSQIPCNLSGVPAGAKYDTWLTVGSSCAAGNALQTAGFNFSTMATSGMDDVDCIAFVAPGSAQGIAGASHSVLIAQLTTRNGQLPTGKVNLVGRNMTGTDLLAFSQSWPAPNLVDCNGNGIHDAYDIRDGVDPDCDESGVPDSCEYTNPNEDCNGNGTADLCDIQSGSSADQNANHVPDECECEGDVDGDGTVNVDDIIEVILAWGDVGSSPADLDGNGLVDSIDLGLVLTYYGGCV